MRRFSLLLALTRGLPATGDWQKQKRWGREAGYRMPKEIRGGTVGIIGYGAIPTFYTENFPTRYRASGASAGYQVSQAYGGGLIPIIAGGLLSKFGIHQAYIYIGGLVMLYALAAIVAIIMTPETKGARLD